MRLLTFILAGMSLFNGVSGDSAGRATCSFPDRFQMSSSQSGTSGYVIKLFSQGTNNEITTTTPGSTISVQISGSKGYLGYMINAVSGNVPFQNTRGKFTSFPTGRTTTCNGVVAGAVSQNLNRASSLGTSDTVSWQAPSTPGNYTFFAVVVVSSGEWYGQTNQIRASISVENSVTTTSTSSSISGLTETTPTEQETSTSTAVDSTRSDGATSLSDYTTTVESQESTRSSITTTKTPSSSTAASSTSTTLEPQNTQDVSSDSFKSFSYFSCLEIIAMALVSIFVQ